MIRESGPQSQAFPPWHYTSIPLYLVEVRHMPTPVELTWLASYNVRAIVINHVSKAGSPTFGAADPSGSRSHC